MKKINEDQMYLSKNCKIKSNSNNLLNPFSIFVWIQQREKKTEKQTNKQKSYTIFGSLTRLSKRDTANTPFHYINSKKMVNEYFSTIHIHQ
jgi:hypothetical protein